MVLFVTCCAPHIVLATVAFDARHWIYSAVNFVLTHVIAAVRKIALGITGKLFTRLKLIPARVTIIAKGFVVARSTRITRGSCVKTVLGIKVGCTVIEGCPLISVTFRTVRT